MLTPRSRHGRAGEYIICLHHAAGMAGQTTGPKSPQIVNILESHDHIWNHHEKCIQINTNMPGIGSLICEIHIKQIQIFGERAKIL